jgi:WD40 repeat protein
MSPMNQIRFSPDGSLVASVLSGNGDVRIGIWDMGSAEFITELTGHYVYVLSMTFSSHSPLFASVDEQSTMRFWSITSWECLWYFQSYDGGVTSIALSSNGSSLVSAGDLIKLWSMDFHTSRTYGGSEVESDTQRTIFEFTDGVAHTLALSSDDSMMASASYDCLIRVWNSNRLAWTFECQTTEIVFSQDGSVLIAPDDPGVRLWNMKTGVETDIVLRSNYVVSFIALSFDDASLAMSCSDKRIRFWDMTSRQESGEIQLDSYAKPILFRPMGNILL